MQAVTKGAPKELLRVNGMPAIYHAVLQGWANGISQVAIIIREGKETISRSFQERKFVASHFPGAVDLFEEFRKNLEIVFFYQSHPRGECDALDLGRKYIGAGPALVVYPDNIVVSGLVAVKEVVDRFVTQGCPTIGLKRIWNADEPNSGGKIKVEACEDGLFNIIHFCSKDHPGFDCSPIYRTSGIYVADPIFFDYISTAKERYPQGEITDDKVRQLMLKDGHSFIGVPLLSRVYDIGSLNGYANCLKAFVKK